MDVATGVDYTAGMLVSRSVGGYYVGTPTYIGNRVQGIWASAVTSGSSSTVVPIVATWTSSSSLVAAVEAEEPEPKQEPKLGIADWVRRVREEAK